MPTNVKKVFEKMTSADLLASCERKATHNANESLHNVLWNATTKIYY